VKNKWKFLIYTLKETPPLFFYWAQAAPTRQAWWAQLCLKKVSPTFSTVTWKQII